jgi:hypothetical protein
MAMQKAADQFIELCATIPVMAPPQLARPLIRAKLSMQQHFSTGAVLLLLGNGNAPFRRGLRCIH